MEGASMIRTKGEAGTGNVVSAVQHARMLNFEMEFTKNNPRIHDQIVNQIIAPFKRLEDASEFRQLELSVENTPFGSLEEVKQEVHQIVSQIGSNNRLPVVTFSAGGIATPADANIDDETFNGWSICWFWNFQVIRSIRNRRSNCSSSTSSQRSIQSGRGM